LIAAGVIGTSKDPLDVNINPGELAVSAGGAIDGISVAINGTVLPSGTMILLNEPPGLVLLNFRPVGGPPGALEAIFRADASLVFLPYGFLVQSMLNTIPTYELAPDLDLIADRTREES
jgi:hypothetical protein